MFYYSVFYGEIEKGKERKWQKMFTLLCKDSNYRFFIKNYAHII